MFYDAHEHEGEPATESPRLGGFLVMEMRGRGVVSMEKKLYFNMSK